MNEGEVDLIITNIFWDTNTQQTTEMGNDMVAMSAVFIGMGVALFCVCTVFCLLYWFGPDISEEEEEEGQKVHPKIQYRRKLRTWFK